MNDKTIMISVLDSGISSGFFFAFEDFDNVNYDRSMSNPFRMPYPGSPLENTESVDEEILAGYLTILRGYDTRDIYKSVKTKPRLEFVCGSPSVCLKKTLSGRIRLYRGGLSEDGIPTNTGTRHTFHIVGPEDETVMALGAAVKDHYERTKDEHIDGTLRDFNACLDMFGGKIFPL
jgi:hypothetical protein